MPEAEASSSSRRRSRSRSRRGSSAASPGAQLSDSGRPDEDWRRPGGDRPPATSSLWVAKGKGAVKGNQGHASASALSDPPGAGASSSSGAVASSSSAEASALDADPAAPHRRPLLPITDSCVSESQEAEEAIVLAEAKRAEEQAELDEQAELIAVVLNADADAEVFGSLNSVEVVESSADSVEVVESSLASSLDAAAAATGTESSDYDPAMSESES